MRKSTKQRIASRKRKAAFILARSAHRSVERKAPLRVRALEAFGCAGAGLSSGEVAFQTGCGTTWASRIVAALAAEGIIVPSKYKLLGEVVYKLASRSHTQAHTAAATAMAATTGPENRETPPVDSTAAMKGKTKAG